MLGLIVSVVIGLVTGGVIGFILDAVIGRKPKGYCTPSSTDTRVLFGTLLGGMIGLGYGFASLSK